MTRKPTLAATRVLAERILSLLQAAVPREASAHLVAAALAHELCGKTAAELETWLDELKELVLKANRHGRAYALVDGHKRPRGYRPLKLPGAFVLLCTEDAARPTAVQVEHNRTRALLALNIASILYLELCAGRKRIDPTKTRLVVPAYRGCYTCYAIATGLGDSDAKEVRALVRRHARSLASLDAGELQQPALFADLHRAGLLVLPHATATFDIGSPGRRQ